MISKADLRKLIEQLPEYIALEDLIERLVLLEKIQVGEQQSDTSQVLSETELDREIRKWFE